MVQFIPLRGQGPSTLDPLTLFLLPTGMKTSLGKLAASWWRQWITFPFCKTVVLTHTQNILLYMSRVAPDIQLPEAGEPPFTYYIPANFFLHTASDDAMSKPSLGGGEIK
jgi:hypothetical protein